MVMLENMKRYLDKGCFSGMLLTDLSKAFDCLVHDLLIANLDAYGFGYNALALIRDYLLGRKQRTKVSVANGVILYIRRYSRIYTRPNSL